MDGWIAQNNSFFPLKRLMDVYISYRLDFVKTIPPEKNQTNKTKRKENTYKNPAVFWKKTYGFPPTLRIQQQTSERARSE